MIDKKSHVTEQERAVLVGLITESQNEDQAEFLKSWIFWLTAGAKAIKHFTQKLPFANFTALLVEVSLLKSKHLSNLTTYHW